MILPFTLVLEVVHGYKWLYFFFVHSTLELSPPWPPMCHSHYWINTQFWVQHNNDYILYKNDSFLFNQQSTPTLEDVFCYPKPASFEVIFVKDHVFNWYLKWIKFIDWCLVKNWALLVNGPIYCSSSNLNFNLATSSKMNLQDWQLNKKSNLL